jgi:hypothetical protein
MVSNITEIMAKSQLVYLVAILMFKLLSPIQVWALHSKMPISFFDFMYKSKRSERGGIGAGLTMVKEYIELLEGSVVLGESSLNKGSSFKIVLPKGNMLLSEEVT